MDLFNLRLPFVYAEYSDVQSTLRLQFPGLWIEAVFRHAALLRERDMDALRIAVLFNTISELNLALSLHKGKAGV